VTPKKIAPRIKWIFEVQLQCDVTAEPPYARNQHYAWAVTSMRVD
jgi:hypothetical protein